MLVHFRTVEDARDAAEFGIRVGEKTVEMTGLALANLKFWRSNQEPHMRAAPGESENEEWIRALDCLESQPT